MTVPRILARAGTGSAIAARAWLQAARHLLAGHLSLIPPRRAEPAAPPRLWLLCRTFPPSVDAGVHRLLALVHAAHASGWQIDVITRRGRGVPHEEGGELARQIPEDVQVHRWDTAPVVPIARITPAVDGGFLEIRHITTAASPLPPPSLILASGPTFGEFVAARVLGKQRGAPYVLDYRDEWTTNLFGFVDRGLTDHFWERFAIARAATVTCATEGMAEHFATCFGSRTASRLKVVRNGWGGGDAIAADTVPPAETPAGGIAFFGTLVDDMDLGLKELCEDLRHLSTTHPATARQLRFDFIGRKTSGVRGLLADFPPDIGVAAEDHQPLSAVRPRMRDARALLVLNGPNARRALPSKVYEYVAAQRPILVYGTGGDTARLLEGVPGVRIVPLGEPAVLAETLGTIYAGVLEAELRQRDAELLHATSREVQSQKFLTILSEVVRHHRVG